MSSTSPQNSPCEWFALQCGWKLLPCNVMVEGTSDVAYFELASRLFQGQNGKSLLGVDLSIFAAGMGDAGGTFGVSEKFPTLFNLAAYDLNTSGSRKFRAIALLDDDRAGRAAIAGITKGHRQIKEFESIFLLKRKLPSKSGSTRKLELDTQHANAIFRGLECTIEDLLAQDFCNRFVSLMPKSMSRAPDSIGGGVRRHWTEDGKRGLRECAERSASFNDIVGVVDTLQSIRSYLSLPPGGV